MTMVSTVGMLAVSAMSPIGTAVADSPLVVVSGPSPFAGCSAPGTSDTVYQNAEVEPRLAINPTNPRNMIGVWQQDRTSGGGARGLVAGATFDGGRTWRESWAHFSDCAGGTAANHGDFQRASDPWVTFGPHGTAYQIALSLDASPPNSGILVSKSIDDGLTWSPPVTLIRDEGNDKEAITADPTRPGNVYAVWSRTAGQGAPSLFSRTTNGSRTWSKPVALTGQDVRSFGDQIVVLPNGTLVDVFSATTASAQGPSRTQTFLAAMRSTNGGRSWSPLRKIADQHVLPVIDPNTGEYVRTGESIPDVAANPRNGTVYAVWADAGPSGAASTEIMLASSRDGGRSWSIQGRVNRTPAGIQVFNPSIGVSSRGVVGVSYYDLRSLKADDMASLPTGYWLARSRDGGASWNETRVGGPFDLRTAPTTRNGFFLGDYNGLVTRGASFIPFFVRTNSGDTANRTDVVMTSIGP
jgi:hypothetical protein